MPGGITGCRFDGLCGWSDVMDSPLDINDVDLFPGNPDTGSMESTYNVGDMIRFYRMDVEGMLEGVIEMIHDDFYWVIGDDGMEYEVDVQDIEGLVE